LFDPVLLGRVRETVAQTSLAERDRRANVRGAFVVNRPEKVHGRSILLVDDEEDITDVMKMRLELLGYKVIESNDPLEAHTTIVRVLIDNGNLDEARRRAEQRGETPSPNDVAEIVRRDRMDSSRKESPLVIPEGARIIDTTNLKIDEILEKILELLP